jgi:hypothetical protein
MNNNRVFHTVTIHGVRFNGIIGRDGPQLSSKRGWTPLVVCALLNFDPERADHDKPLPSGWWVVKYSDEVRLRLVDFSPAEIQHLAAEFGIAFLGGEDETGPLDRRRVTMFEASPAWDGLRRWVAAHPLIARQHAEDDDYIPGWLNRALVQNAMLRWPGGTIQ